MHRMSHEKLPKLISCHLTYMRNRKSKKYFLMWMLVVLFTYKVKMIGNIYII